MQNKSIVCKKFSLVSQSSSLDDIISKSELPFEAGLSNKNLNQFAMQAVQAIGHKTKLNKNHWVFVVQFYIYMYCIADTLAASLWPKQFIQP